MKDGNKKKSSKRERERERKIMYVKRIIKALGQGFVGV